MKPRNRKVKGFFIMVGMTIVLAALKAEFTWPLTVLLLGLYLSFAGFISAEDVLMAWIQKGGRADVQMVGEGRSMGGVSPGDSRNDYRPEIYD